MYNSVIWLAKLKEELNMTGELFVNDFRYQFPSSEANSPEKHVKTETGIIETEKKVRSPGK